MRIRSQKQLYFKIQSVEIDAVDELEAISARLGLLPVYDAVLGKILKDLTPNGSGRENVGRNGMTAEQVLRALIVKMLRDYSYRKLAHATCDSISVREFLKIGPYEKGFHFKTLQANIKLLEEDTLDLVIDAIKNFALSEDIEDGEAVRTDGFTTEVNIHYPTDWSLMNDSIRVLSRIMTYAHEDLCVPIKFMNHYRASKTKLFKVHNTKSQKKRKKLNLELIRLTRKTLSYARDALPVMESFDGCRDVYEFAYLEGLIADLKHYMPLVEQVIDQAHRRIVQGEKVPSEEKLVSIFDEHTDIISKGSRDVVFGHKSTITTGKSGLVLVVEVHDGNPADSTLVEGVIDAHKSFYGDVPQSSVFDGCYSSSDNRKFAASEGIENVCFSKETDEDSSCTRAVRKILRNFRAGIEASVSMLKRMFGLGRIMDKGMRSFRTAVKAGVMAYNFFILSRIPLKT